jgi:predicted TIM-barrel fold metal-dependent hydrolase
MYMNLEDMEAVIRDYPEMQLVAVHALFPRFQLAHRLLSEYPNFWLDMTNSISCMRLYVDIQNGREDIPPMATNLEVDDVRENYDYFFRLFEDFPGRIMYGTDFPVGFGYHPALLEDMKYFELGRGAEECMLFRTVQNLLSECGHPDLLADLDTSF